MNCKIKLLCSTSFVAMASASTLAAQEFYLGAGVGFGTATESVTSGRDSYTTGSIIGGVTFQSGMYFYGAEANYGFILQENDDVFDTFTFSSLDSTYRLRGIVGVELGGFDVFASLGLFGASGESFFFSGSGTGLTYGLGAQMDVTDSLAIRLEVIQDQMTPGDFSYPGNTWQNTSVRAAAILTF